MIELRNYRIKYYYTLILFCSVFTSCAYRFTNKYLRVPKGIQSIAVEAVFDTSREPVPHEVLWENIQKAFAANGRLQVVSPQNADAFLRAHIKRSIVLQTSVETNEIKVDPSSPIDSSTLEAYPLTKYSNLRVADQYSKRETFKSEVFVEIWDLHKRKILMKKSYSINGDYPIFDGRTNSLGQFIKAEEAFEHAYDQRSKLLSTAIVNDFMSMIQ